MKILNPKLHGSIDYLAVLILLLAPSVFRFGGVAAGLSYALGVIHLGLTVLTNYPVGLAKIIPFPVHGAIEGVEAILLVLIPFLFRFSDVPAARNFYIASGIVLAGVWAVTDYRAVERTTGTSTTPSTRRYA